MDTEDQVFQRFDAKLETIAALDRRYYLNPLPTKLDRAAYAMRQDYLQNMRERFYEQLGQLRAQIALPRRCRVLIRQRAR